MKRPVWHFEIVRDTNAPFALVRETLLNGQSYHLWHPRCTSATPEVIEDGECLEIVCRFNRFGIHEEARYRVEPVDSRLLLTYKNRFKGWLVLPLMGWWRVKSEHIWERFIASLPQKED